MRSNDHLVAANNALQPTCRIGAIHQRLGYHEPQCDLSPSFGRQLSADRWAALVPTPCGVQLMPVPDMHRTSPDQAACAHSPKRNVVVPSRRCRIRDTSPESSVALRNYGIMCLRSRGYQGYAGSVMPREDMSNQSDNETNHSTGDEARQHTREVVRVHQTRLHVLELQAAKLGDYVPPHVVTEINDIRTEIAHLIAELNATTPAIARSSLRQLRQQALKAYYTQKWAQAEELFSQVLQHDLNDTDVQAKLEDVQSKLTLQAMYQLICELRDAHQGQATLDALDDLEQLQPDYPGAAELREWAEKRSHRETEYAWIVEMYQRNALGLAHVALEGLLKHFPEDVEAQEMLAQVLTDLEREGYVYRATSADATSTPPEDATSTPPEDATRILSGPFITIEPEQAYLELTPGQVTMLRLDVINSTDVVDRLHVVVEGVPGAWIVPSEPIVVSPGRAGCTVLPIAVPKAPESKSGEYPVLLRAISEENPSIQDTAISKSIWTVLPFFESTLKIKPKKARGRWEGNYAVSVTNMGNTIQSYTLVAEEDDEDILEYIFKDEQIVLEPGQTAIIKLTVRPRERKWIGRSHIYNFNVRCRSQDGTEQIVIATFASQAIITG
jgi:hypothetical protein